MIDFENLVNGQKKIKYPYAISHCRPATENGGIILTENNQCQPIYHYLMRQSDFGRNAEHKVLAIALKDNKVCVLPAFNKYETLDGKDLGDVFDNGNWFPANGTTLYSICEVIDEYILHDNLND